MRKSRRVMDVVENRATRGGQSDCTAGQKKKGHGVRHNMFRTPKPDICQVKENKLGMTSLEDGSHRQITHALSNLVSVGSQKA